MVFVSQNVNGQSPEALPKEIDADADLAAPETRHAKYAPRQEVCEVVELRDFLRIVAPNMNDADRKDTDADRR